MTFYIYKDKAYQYRWYLRASNGRKLADSGEGYVSKSDCLHAIRLIQRGGGDASVVDLG